MLSALLAVPGAAQPPSCDAPPGVAGVDQYCEDTPGTSPDGRDGDRRSSVPGDTERRVRDEPGGPALLESLPGGAAYAGRGGPSGDDDDGRSGAGRRGVPGSAPGSDAVGPPGDAVSGVASAGSSLWFGEMRVLIVLLGLTLVAAIALGARRRASSD
jgi:hypothetical protein